MARGNGAGGATGGLHRILLTGEAAGGVWSYSLELAGGLAAAGIAVVLAVLGPPPSAAQMAEANAIPGLWVVPTNLPAVASAADPEALRSTGAVLAGLAQRVRADTVHLHTPALAAEVAWAQPVLAVVHADFGTWWDAVHRSTALPEALGWRAEVIGRGLAEADAVVAPTRSLARALSRRYRPGRSIAVVPHGRTPRPMPSHPRQPVVLTAGRLWDEGKNIAALDRAAALLDVPVLAAGPLRTPDGEAGIALHLARPLGVLDPLTLAAHMATATVFAAPSRHEAFGLAVLEAAQAGMALALADIPAFRELWDGAALFFDPEDAERLADVVRRLLAAPAGHAARARERAERYPASAMVAATLGLHTDLVRGRSILCA